MAVGDESRLEFVVVQLLHGHFLIDRKASSRRGRLAGDHEDRFHADASEGGVARREGEGGEEVFAFVGLGNDCAVADLIGAKASATAGDLAFAGDDTVLHDATDFVDVRSV